MAGNISTSSLLSSAASRANKIRETEDALISFDWQQSAKTYGDFVEYSSYLNERAKSAPDPLKALGYRKTLESARTGYISNEIQRQNIAVVEGNMTNMDKYGKLVDLYQQAVDAGNYDLAQSLNLQIDNLSVKIQNEQLAAQEAAQRGYANAASAKAKSVKELMTKLEKGVDDITLADGTKVTPLAAIADSVRDTGITNATWNAAQDTLAALRQVVIDQYNGATTQEEIDALEQKYGAGLKDIDSTLNFSIGGKNLTAQDIQVAAENSAINNPIYGLKAVRNEATGKNEYKLVENNVDRAEFTRQYDPTTGQEYYAPIQVRTDREKLMFGNSDQGRGLGTQITSSGEVIGGQGEINLGTGKVKRDDSQTIGNRLKELGIIAEQNGTTLNIKLPGENVSRQATIQPDGSIRYFTDDGQLAEIGLVDRNLGSDAVPYDVKAGEMRIVDPSETSDFAQASKFGGVLSQASPAGKEYTRSFLSDPNSPVNQVRPMDLRDARITGVGNATGIAGPIRTANDFSGKGSPITSTLLQSARFTQGNVAKELQAKAEALRLQAQAEAARIQQAQVFNLNQTPVAQFANNGVLKRQLQVQPVPTQRITSVGVAKPTQRITSVGAASSGGKLKVVSQ